MAKKADRESTAKTPRRKAAGKEISLACRTEEGRSEGDGDRLQRPLLDTRVVYCGDDLEQLGLCRTGQFLGETKEKRAFEDRHENTKAYIDNVTNVTGASEGAITDMDLKL